MSRAQHTDLILETIDQLRKRKARPDLERICHMVERKHGVSFENTVCDLERLVEEEIVVKVDYKGSTSYRNAAKWKKSPLGGQVLNSNDMGRKIQSIVLTICEEAALDCGGVDNINSSLYPEERSLDDIESATTAGASAQDIEDWLVQNDPDFVWCKQNLQTVLDREVQAKHLEKLPNGKYIVVEMVPGTPTKANMQTEAASPSTSGSNMGAAPQISQACKTSPGRKGRPPTKRKKFKKSLGPDFEHYSVVKKKRGKNSTVTPPPTKDLEELMLMTPDPVVSVIIDGADPRCDYCLQTSSYNRMGVPEKLLICKDCQAKAHPSCMDYSVELAKRARNSPWQCIDCKTCYICADSGEPDAMLFCDACDKGYHMVCHNPPVEDKPTGKWVCGDCMSELGLNEDEVAMYIENASSKTELPEEDATSSLLPSPSNSPIQFQVDNNNGNCISLNGKMAAPIPKLASSLDFDVPDASDWAIDDVVSYFMALGFLEHAEVFREQEIDGKSLLLMKRSDVLTGLSLKLGPALKVYAHIQRLQTRGQILF